MAKRVYIVHAYSDHLSHVEKIIKLNPDLILLWSDIEYDVLYIFNRFISAITDYLQANNKTITILYPGPNKKLNDYVFLEKTYGYQLVLQESLIEQTKNVDFSNIHLDSTKLYTLYCNRGSHERLKIIDTFARENMINDGVVTFRGVHFGEDLIRWEYHDGSVLSDEDDFILNTKEHYSPQHFPKSFFNGFVDVVCESRVNNHEFFVTEKTAKSIVSLKPFLVLSSQYYYRYLLEEYGIVPYSEIFDYSFDDESDINQRIEGIVENIKKLKTLDKNEVHSRLFDKLVYNKNQLCNYSQMKEKMVPKSLEFVFSEPYEFLGDAYATEKWLKLVSDNSWTT